MGGGGGLESLFQGSGVWSVWSYVPFMIYILYVEGVSYIKWVGAQSPRRGFSTGGQYGLWFEGIYIVSGSTPFLYYFPI